VTDNSNRRKSLEIEGVSHGAAPIPMGSQIGNLVYSSGIMGKDPTTDKLPPDPAQEIELVFQNVKSLTIAAGGTLDDIIRMSVYLKDNNLREAINREWLKMFPDEMSRPARHITLSDLPGGMNVQIEIVAVVQT
jgi:2-iminobutanoate/2-iminopropanoate deaminase